MAVIELTLFGGFGARWSGGQIIDLPGQKDRALLAILALRPGISHTRDKLAGLLWSDRADKQARDSLKHSLNDLRRCLHLASEPMIVASRQSVTLDAASATVDVALFEHLLGLGTPETLERAVALYQGDLLEGFAVHDAGFEDWLVAERQRLRHSAEEALMSVMASLIDAGKKDRAASVARRLLSLDPLREAACRALMHVEAGRGQTVQALKMFESLRERLHRELGIKPEAATTQLYEAIRLRSGATPSAPNQLPEGSPAEMDPKFADQAPSSRPFVAILPFQNLSDDPEQEYFVDGITEDVITDLSKVSGLNVVSRGSSFAFKGKNTESGPVARQLKVGFIVEGSVRKVGTRIRITAQLIDAGKDNHLWAERYDRDLDDIFVLQGEISEAIVAALRIKLLPEERKAIESRSTQNLEAYQLYLLARHNQTQYTTRGQEVALRLGQRAVEIDPAYARAWSLVGVCQASLHLRGRSEDSGLASAEKALSLDPALAEAHAARARVLAELGRFDEALVSHEKSLCLEPDSFDVQSWFGRTRMLLGHHEAAIAHYERAAQLVETNYICLSLVASSYHALGREAECRSAARRAIERMERAIALRPDDAHALAMGASDLVYLGETQRAKEWASRALTIDPDDPMIRYNLACAMAHMNETDQALDLLAACADKMSAARIHRIKHDPSLISLHGHPRYQALVARGESRLTAVQSEQALKSS